MRALIIDDEVPARAALRGLLRAHPEITVVGEADTMESAAKLLARSDYDFVLLDIQLRGGTGFDLVPLVRAEAPIIFVSAYDNHAVRAFEVNALDYVVKPVRPQRLAEAIRRLSIPPIEPRSSLVNVPAFTQGDLVYLKSGTGHARFVQLADIAAIESHENYSEVHLGDGTRIFVRRTMKSWEETLPATHFVRVHRTMIVNLARYRSAERESYETTLLHLDGLPAPARASFRYLPELRERLAAFGRQL
jgi:two-component system LytT family response regulator